MKMSFARNGLVQVPVSPEQHAMRAARPRPLPMGRIALAVAAVAAVAALGWWLLDRTTIYSYGVVATGVEMFHAPVRSRVVSVHVEPGDRIAADSVLCVLVSDDAQTELKEAQETLAQQRGILETMLAQEHAAFEDPAVELRDLENARARLQELERNADAGAAAREGAAERQRQEIERLTRQVAFRDGVIGDRAQRLAAVRALRQDGAALPAEEEEASAAERLARYERDDAKSQLDATIAAQEAEQARQHHEEESARAAVALGRSYVETLTALYARARAELERVRIRGLENIRSRIAGLEARAANLKKLAGPTEVRALADGVVTEVFVTDGSNVPKDAELMSVSGTGKLWINAFVPPERARDLHVNAAVTVYPTTGVHGLAGRVTAGGGIQYKVHPSLRDRITDPSAVYVRIDLDGSKPDLIPGNVVRVVIR
jgi:multidrug resistance efflux pump